MAGSKSVELLMSSMMPHTFNALQKLVMAMADVAKNAGKKTFFGRDKGQESYDRFLTVLKVTTQSMVLDRLTKESSSTEHVADILFSKIELFSEAYPNWQDAYGFAVYFFIKNRDDAIAVIDRMRGGSGQISSYTSRSIDNV